MITVEGIAKLLKDYESPSDREHLNAKATLKLDALLYVRFLMEENARLQRLVEEYRGDGYTGEAATAPDYLPHPRRPDELPHPSRPRPA